MTSNSDHNLLFGIIALQMDFVRREQLVAATSTWLTDKARQIDEILVEQGALSETDRQLLAPLVARHLENHDGDPQQSLAALSSIGSVAEDLRLLGDENIEATLSMVGSDRPSNLHEETVAHESKASTAAGAAIHASTDARFRVLRSHAKGGLGEVYVAKDTELNREVALKEIQSRFADDEASRLRFLLEAEVTGGLEHPGIVPVYGLGCYEDGRPFYAMRFIKGDSLQEAADRFHRQVDGAQPDFGSVEFRKLLGRFVDVCQAIEYAHSRGVLHRDLKPGNIMLGKYGETLVVDWGLARTQAADDSNAATAEMLLRPASASGSAPTVMGSAIGTPAFMPPEQAAGELDQLGPGSDVYSLGATLYYLLTGRGPYQGRDIVAVLKGVQAGNFPKAGSIKRGAPKALDAVCQKAMALNIDDRYQNPLALSDDIERYLADEAVSAFAEPLVLKARRWVRNHQTLSVTTAAVVLVSVIGLGAFSTIVNNKNVQLTELNTALEGEKNNELDKKNSELTTANTRERDAKNLAAANERAAKQQSQLALSTLTSVVNDIQSGLSKLSGSSEIRRQLLKTSLEKLEFVASDFVAETTVDRNTMIALAEMADVILQFGTDDERSAGASRANATAGTASAVALAETLYRRVLDIAQTLAAADPSDMNAQHNLSTALSKLGDVSVRAGQTQTGLEFYQQSLKVNEQQARENPMSLKAEGQLARSLERVGFVKLEAGQSHGVRELFSRCLEIREKIAAAKPKSADDQRNLSIALGQMAEISKELRSLDESRQYLERKLRIDQQLTALDRSNAHYQRLLSVSYHNLGDVSSQQGQLQEALDYYEKAHRVIESLAAAESKNAQLQHDLTIGYTDLGDTAMKLDQLEKALDYYRQGLAAAEKLATDLEDTVARRALAISLDRMASFNRRQGQLDKAIEYLRKSQDISMDLGRRDPANAAVQRDLANGYKGLGEVSQQMGRLRDALRYFRKMNEINVKRVAAKPDSAVSMRDLAESHLKVAQTHQALDEFTKAAIEFRGGATVLRRMMAQNMDQNRPIKQVVGLFDGYAEAATRMDSALGDWQTLMEQPRESLPELLAIRGIECAKRSRFPEAAQAAAKLRQLDNTDNGQLYNAACAFSLCAASVEAPDGKTLTDEQTVQRDAWIMDAMTTLKKAIEAGWDDFDRMQKDEALATIRDRPEFKALIPQSD